MGPRGGAVRNPLTLLRIWWARRVVRRRLRNFAVVNWEFSEQRQIARAGNRAIRLATKRALKRGE